MMISQTFLTGAPQMNHKRSKEVEQDCICLRGMSRIFEKVYYLFPLKFILGY